MEITFGYDKRTKEYIIVHNTKRVEVRNIDFYEALEEFKNKAGDVLNYPIEVNTVVEGLIYQKINKVHLYKYLPLRCVGSSVDSKEEALTDLVEDIQVFIEVHTRG